MAKKTAAPAAAKKTVTVTAPKSTPVRNTPVPKAVAVAAKKAITHELIAERAYFIAMSGNGGSQEENWHRAERELRGETL